MDGWMDDDDHNTDHDVLTSAALPGRLAALDVGVTSPDAAEVVLTTQSVWRIQSATSTPDMRTS